MRPILIVVDMQNDFTTGSLAVPGALEIVGGIQDLVHQYDTDVIFTRCWHPPNHCSFIEYGGKWPRHCVRFTDGARLQVGLGLQVDHRILEIVNKGQDPLVEEYSGFYNPELDELIKDWGDPTKLDYDVRLDICGLARDYCVEATAQAAIARGYKVNVIEELCRAVGK